MFGETCRKLADAHTLDLQKENATLKNEQKKLETAEHNLKNEFKKNDEVIKT